MVFFVIYFCLYLTYGSFYAAGILIIPVVLSQLAAEAWWCDAHRPQRELAAVAAAGANVGVDYGIYHFSRMVDAYARSISTKRSTSPPRPPAKPSSSPARR
jgi:hypothetical protein